ncbi:MAG TPA: hypothetical protein VG498_17170 [Terriglobales bacterium]|nr:hypothetical protein [Terriglobales bacterium]
MPKMKSDTSAELPFRHTLATLAYRAAKPLKDAPPGFSEFRPGKDSRSAGEILSHLCDLLDWALSMARGKEEWRDSKPKSWSEDSRRFFAALEAFDSYVSSGQTLHAPCEKLFQGAIADALTHVGQVAMLRRLAGGAIRPENYSVAKIEAGRVGANQNAPVAEF